MPGHAILVLECYKCGEPDEHHQPEDGDLWMAKIEPGASRLTGFQATLIGARQGVLVVGHVDPSVNA